MASRIRSYFVSFACTYPDGSTHFGRANVDLDHPVICPEDLRKMEHEILGGLPVESKDKCTLVALSWRRFEPPE